MARPSKPWFWDARNCWAVTIDGKRHTAPRSIGPKDTLGALNWHKSIVDGAVPVKVGNYRVADVCELYLAWDENRVLAKQRCRRSHESCKCKLTRACATVVDGVKAGSMPVAAIKKRNLEKMLMTWAGEELSDLYRRDLGANLKAAFSWATHEELIPVNPFSGVSLPSEPESAVKFATRSEAASWLRFLWRQGLKDFAFLQRCLIHSGARPSELTRATWDEVAWDSWTDKSGHAGAVITRTAWKSSRKTGKARRVYLPPCLCRSLRRRMRAVLDPSKPIFSTVRGIQWSASNLSTVTERCRQLAIKQGLPFKDEGSDRLHCYRWRHTAASTLLTRGVPVPTVAELLGTSVRMISKTYSHILNSHLIDAASQL